MPRRASVGEGHHFGPGWGPSSLPLVEPTLLPGKGRIRIKPGPLQGRVEADITPVSPGMRGKPLHLATGLG